jgi:hypothetical protein
VLRVLSVFSLVAAVAEENAGFGAVLELTAAIVEAAIERLKPALFRCGPAPTLRIPSATHTLARAVVSVKLLY